MLAVNNTERTNSINIYCNGIGRVVEIYNLVCGKKNRGREKGILTVLPFDDVICKFFGSRFIQ